MYDECECVGTAIKSKKTNSLCLGSMQRICVSENISQEENVSSFEALMVTSQWKKNGFDNHRSRSHTNPGEDLL